MDEYSDTEQGENRAGTVPWRGRDALYVTLLYLLSLLFLSCPLAGARGSGLDLFVLLPLGIITLIWTRLYRSSGLLLGSQFRFGPGAMLRGVLTGIFALLLELAFAWAVLAIFEPDLLTNLEEAISEGGFSGDPVLVLTAVILAPVTEELFFRGLLQQGLQRSFGGGVAITVSSLLFGLAHFGGSLIENVIAVGTGIIVGVILGLTFLRSENLALPIAAHATLNAGALLLLTTGL